MKGAKPTKLNYFEVLCNISVYALVGRTYNESVNGPHFKLYCFVVPTVRLG